MGDVEPMTKGQELVQRQTHEVNVVQGPSPLEIFAKAMDKGIPLEQIKELRAMVEWHEGREAEKAFNAAMSKFRAEAITIIKNKTVGYDHREGGGRTSYQHATLDAVLEAAVPKLSEHGLSHRWETRQEGGNITVTCIITHEQGHSFKTSLSAGADNSGKKNSIQAIGSTISYLERYTFMAATGLAAKGEDDDGRKAVIDADDGTITAAQVKLLQKLIKETGTDEEAFLDWLGFDTLEVIPEKDFHRGMAELNRKKRAIEAREQQ